MSSASPGSTVRSTGTPAGPRDRARARAATIVSLSPRSRAVSASTSSMSDSPSRRSSRSRSYRCRELGSDDHASKTFSSASSGVGVTAAPSFSPGFCLNSSTIIPRFRLGFQTTSRARRRQRLYGDGAQILLATRARARAGRRRRLSRSRVHAQQKAKGRAVWEGSARPFYRCPGPTFKGPSFLRALFHERRPSSRDLPAHHGARFVAIGYRDFRNQGGPSYASPRSSGGT